MTLVARAAALPRPLLLALDVDGTLAPIVDDPSAARVSAETVAVLEGFVARDDVIVALVSGRDAASLSRVAPVRGAYRAVEHGRVVVGPGEEPEPPVLSEAMTTALAVFEAKARSEWTDARLELKATSRAVHVRELETRDADRAAVILEEASHLAATLGLHPRPGRAVLEAEALPGDKGLAIERLLEATGAASVVYAGDDLTDLPAIERAAKQGIGVFVTSPEREAPAMADVHLDGPGAVAAFLRDLALAL